MSDIVIIGMGITGCTLAWRLNKRYPEKKILCIERLNRYGGRILSEQWNNQIVDLGAWRYSPISHKYVQSLVSLFSLETVYIDSKEQRESIPFDVPVTLNAKSIGFVEYMYSLGYTRDDIEQYGYNIFEDDISLELMINESKIQGPFFSLKYGYIQLCTHMMKEMNNNVKILFNIDVTSIQDRYIMTKSGRIPYSSLYCTVQPDVLQHIYPYVSIVDSMIGYSAIRIYCQMSESSIPLGLYISDTPIRKLYILPNNITLIYVDGPDARVIESIAKKNWTLLNRWISEITGEYIHIISLIYKYWKNGIFFWRPRVQRRVSTPFYYLNGDISDEPGWVNGCLSLVDKYLR